MFFFFYIEHYLFFFLQYCLGFAIHQHASATNHILYTQMQVRAVTLFLRESFDKRLKPLACAIQGGIEGWIIIIIKKKSIMEAEIEGIDQVVKNKFAINK